MGNLKTSKEEVLKYINSGEKSAEEVKEFNASGKKQLSYKELNITHDVGNLFKVDSQAQCWYAQDQFGLHRTPIYAYEDIMDFELLEDGNTITKGGLGSAVVGGLTFGALGAVVGASTGKRTSNMNCTSMRIKVSLKNMDTPIEYINLIQTKVAKKSAAYKKAYEQAQEILALLQIMIHGNEKSDVLNEDSATDEIMKYKRLLDVGAITEEEFQAKKKQLLEL